MTEQVQVIVYHHTHWDREWWATFQEIRHSLVKLIDELLDILEADPDFKSFFLDGQTIVLQDYLEIRPENRERLLQMIRAGRIHCGPWYILPDEFLVSGEAHIRNLWLGLKLAEELGFSNLPVGYLPDTFGHISQMPQILQGFGLGQAMVWRGLGGSVEEMPQEFWWESPDGSRVFTYWFPDGYYMVDFLHFDNPEKTYEETFGRVRRSLERWKPRASTQWLLMPYGGDHRRADPRLPRLLREVNAEFSGFAEFIWGTTKDFLDKVQSEARAWPVRQGEFREQGPQHPHLLPGVLSARMYLK
ncbi:MAG: alpha-mannosidase, partial [Alicyclobacillus sp.]|nr:alpha-mannosidase [Alicyclobacillus sp.]